MDNNINNDVDVDVNELMPYQQPRDLPDMFPLESAYSLAISCVTDLLNVALSSHDILSAHLFLRRST